MYKLLNVYQEIQDSIGYFLKLVRLGKKEGLTPEQTMQLVKVADNIHKLQEKLQQLQSEVVDIEMKKSKGKEQLKVLQNEIEATRKKLNSADRAFKVKYEELSDICSRIRSVERMPVHQNRMHNQALYLQPIYCH